MKMTVLIPLALTSIIIVCIAFIGLKRHDNPQYPFEEIRTCIIGERFISDSKRTINFISQSLVEIDNNSYGYFQQGNRITLENGKIFYQDCDSNAVKDLQGRYYFLSK